MDRPPGVERANAFTEHMEIFALAERLGGVESSQRGEPDPAFQEDLPQAAEDSNGRPEIVGPRQKGKKKGMTNAEAKAKRRASGPPTLAKSEKR